MMKILSALILMIGLFSGMAFSQELEIENIHAKGDVGTAKITWNIKYDQVPQKGKLIIRYLESNLTKLNSNPNWNYSEPIDPRQTSFELSGLAVNEKFKFAIGYIDTTEALLSSPGSLPIDWTKSKSFETIRGWSFGTGLVMRILMLLGSLALFIYGMKIMSEGIQRAAGQKLRDILGKVTSNRLKGIFTGFLTTSIIQSSSATTVMVVSFVNAGLLTLKQSIGVIMGANIGTTVTAWIVAFLGFSVSMSDYSLPILLVALILLFSNKGNLKSWGEMLVGFSILFLALELLKSGVPDVKGNVESLAFLQSLSENGMLSTILFVVIGTIVTVVVQSSSAAMAVTILLCERGIIPFEMAASMVLGENIGTTITANIAAIVGNVHAKRAARAHLIFNVFGVTWLILIFPWYIGWIDQLVSIELPSPSISQESRPVALALFHTIFNIANVLILVWFTPRIAKIVTKMVPSRSSKDEDFSLDYISAGVLSTPELFLLEAQKELAKFGKITSKMSKFVQNLMFEQDKKEKKKLYGRIEKYEDITDKVEIEISRYLNECAENELSHESTMKVRAMLAITNDLERIGDIFYQMSVAFKRKEEEKIWFTPEQRANIKSMLVAIDEAFVVMIANLNKNTKEIDIAEALQKEETINKLRDKYRADYLASIEDHEFNIKSGVIYTDLIYSCEKVGDHIINVTEALIGRNIIGE